VSVMNDVDDVMTIVWKPGNQTHKHPMIYA
jgi:hypothetical protein